MDWLEGRTGLRRSQRVLKIAGGLVLILSGFYMLNAYFFFLPMLSAYNLVQNRCYARTGWDREVRAFCRDRNIVYQGFSLLTANPVVLRHPLVASIAARCKATPAQVIFRFSQAIEMLPLTGTSSAEHMQQDLASRDLALSADEVRKIESLAC